MRRALVLLVATLLSGLSSVQAEEGMSNEQIARASQNPITAIYSLPIQNNTGFGVGATDKVRNVANFQPVVPMDLSDNWDLIWRLILPITTTPGVPTAFNGSGEATAFSGSVTGLGDSVNGQK